MSLPAYKTNEKLTHRVLRGLAIPSSVVAHLVLAWMFIAPPQAAEKTEQWIEMTVVEKPPPPPPEPPPEPEPKPKPKPKAKKIDFKDIPKEPEPAPKEPPPKEKKKVRRVQGLKATSFAKGANTGLTVRAGTTLGTKATDETLSLDEAANSTAISYAAATKQPRRKKKPSLEVPQSIIEAEIEGRVLLVIDIAADGNVSAARIKKSLHPDADSACLKSWLKAKFDPAMQGDSPVAVTNFPGKCRFKSIN